MAQFQQEFYVGQPKKIRILLTDCINSWIEIKKRRSFWKTSLQDLSVYFLHSKRSTKKSFHQLLNTFYENKLSPLLRGFRSRYSTQHALLNLNNKWQSCLDNSRLVRTILMDLFKAFDCLAHEPVLAKLHAYRVEVKSLKLLLDNLSIQTQRVKLDSTFS